jgi:hypothetical protein
MRLAKEMGMLRTGTLFPRGSIVVSVVALGLALGEAASGRAAAAGREGAVALVAESPPREGGCQATRIRGLTDNRTSSAMEVTQTGNGVTNEWCRAPEDVVPAGRSNGWLAGDDSGDVDVNIVYRLQNGDEVLFVARVRKAGGTETGCSFLRVVRTPREFECEAEVVAAGSGVAFVRFSVRARAASSISRFRRSGFPIPSPAVLGRLRS